MIKLDVCCGQYKHEGYVGMDKRAMEGVDIVHDVQVFPWPVEDNSCELVTMLLSWCCIEPKYRLQLMDEFWRITAKDGRLGIADQYYTGDRAQHDPISYSCPNEWTFLYYDPSHEKYKVYELKPWHIIILEYQPKGLIRVLLTPIKEIRA